MAKPVGRRGSWFARWKGDDLPCVHQHWLRGLWYDDPYAKPGDPQWDAFISAIAMSQRVILTRDAVEDTDKGEAIRFTRQDYIAAFDVDEIAVEGGHLRFRLVGRLEFD